MDTTDIKSGLSALFILTSTLLPFISSAKVTHLLPTPKSVTELGGEFKLGGEVDIEDPTESDLLQDFFSGYGCSIVAGGTPVTVNLVSEIEGAYDYELAGYPNEAYTLSVKPDAITITAITPTGVIRAAPRHRHRRQQKRQQQKTRWPHGQTIYSYTYDY